MTDFTFDDLDMKDLHEIHSVMKKDKKNHVKTLGASFCSESTLLAHWQDTLLWTETSAYSKK